MTHELSLALINPGIALIFSLVFLILWRLRPNVRHSRFLAAGFFLAALAFLGNDFLAQHDGPVLRIVINTLFTAAVMFAMSGAFVRVGLPVPVRIYAAVAVLFAFGVGYYLFAQPSTAGRIYVVNIGYAGLAAFTMFALVRAKPASTVDWSFVGFAGLVLVLSLLRPLALASGLLEANPDGSVARSSYWTSIQAVTPFLALVLGLSFVAAMAFQVITEMRQDAEQDYLTGLANRRGFATRVQTLLEAVPDDQRQAAVLVADIDDFKAINETFGHGVGDKVIAGAARVLQSSARADVLARIGGEEFAAFYGDTRRGDLLQIAEEIRDVTARMEVQGLPRDYPVTISIGIHPRHQAQSFPDMLDEARLALYAAKKAGKNRARISDLCLRTVA